MLQYWQPDIRLVRGQCMHDDLWGLLTRLQILPKARGERAAMNRPAA